LAPGRAAGGIFNRAASYGKQPCQRVDLRTAEDPDAVLFEERCGDAATGDAGALKAAVIDKAATAGGASLLKQGEAKATP